VDGSRSNLFAFRCRGGVDAKMGQCEGRFIGEYKDVVGCPGLCVRLVLMLLSYTYVVAIRKKVEVVCSETDSTSQLHFLLTNTSRNSLQTEKLKRSTDCRQVFLGTHEGEEGLSGGRRPSCRPGAAARAVPPWLPGPVGSRRKKLGKVVQLRFCLFLLKHNQGLNSPERGRLWVVKI
jgi:hypothetical protein